jgi:hypothetical protein
MFIVGILFGLMVAAFFAMVLVAVIRGQPVSKPSSETGETNPTHGPYGGPEYSDSLAVRNAAQTFGRDGRTADWIAPWEAPHLLHRRKDEEIDD